MMSRFQFSPQLCATIFLTVFFTNVSATAQSSPTPVEMVIPKLVNHAPLPPIKGLKREVIINFLVGEDNKIKSITKVAGNLEIIPMVKPYLVRWKFSGPGSSKMKFIIKYYTTNDSNQTKQPSDTFIHPDTMVLHFSLPTHND